MRQIPENSGICRILVGLAFFNSYKSRIFRIIPNYSGIEPIANRWVKKNFDTSLKAIAHKTGIDKALFMHLGRHTFATTVTMSNGLSIESVSSMLGHSSLKHTQIYAKIVNKKVKNDMEKIKDCFSWCIEGKGLWQLVRLPRYEMLTPLRWGWQKQLVC